MISMEKEAKLKISKQGLNGVFAMCEDVTELTSVSSDLTSRQLVCGARKKTKADSQRLLYRGPRVRKSAAAALGATHTGPRRLKVVLIERYGYEMRALLDSGAVSSLVSEKVWNWLTLEVG